MGSVHKLTTFSIIIATKDRPNHIRRLLRLLSKQTFQNFEVIIVDESRDPATKKICEEFSKHLPIKYFHRKLGSLPRARNFGIKHANGEIIIFMDDDIAFKKDFLEKLNSLFEEDKSIVGLQGIIISKRLLYPLKRNALRKALMLSYIGGKSFSIRRSGTATRPPVHTVHKRTITEWFEGCCFAVRSFVFKKINFDENPIFWAFMEDLDFSYRLSKLSAGKLVIEPKIKVYHLITEEARLADLQSHYMSLVYWAYFFFKNLRSSFLNVLAFIYGFFIGELLLRIIRTVLNPRDVKSIKLLLISLKAKKDVLLHLKELVSGNIKYFNREIVSLARIR